MAPFEEIAAFVREETGYCGSLTEATALHDDLGVAGDDLWELIDAYSTRFAVDVSSFLWYFHSAEEGSFSLGALFYPPPDALVPHIPITLGMLHDFVQGGRWAVKYPVREVPQSRPDIRINQLVAVTWMAAVVVLVVLGCLR